MSQKKKPMQIFVQRTLPGCSGCRICEKVCAIKHEGSVNPEKSRIRVYQFYPGIDVPIVCQYCLDRPCVNACPTNALTYDDKNFTMNVNESLCTQCRACYSACSEKGRGGCITFHPSTGVAQICDLCGGDPECVKYCPSDVLKFFPHAQTLAKRLAKPPEVFAERIAEQYYPAKTRIV